MSDHHQLEQRIDKLERRLKQFEHSQHTIDRHVAAIESSLIYRLLGAVGRPLLNAKALAAKWLLQSPLRDICRGWFAPDAGIYASWAAQYRSEALPVLDTKPVISLLMKASPAPPLWMREAIASVLAQSYQYWELCVYHAGDLDIERADYLAAMARSDSRIRVHRATSDTVGPAINEAAVLATGDYFVALDSSTRFDPHALHWIASKSPADLIYTDEDTMDEDGRPLTPLFKPDWSPDLLLSCMYLGRSFAISRAAWERCGGVRREFEPAWEYDLALRVTDAPSSVQHASPVMCHTRRRPPGPDEIAASRRALEDTLIRRGANAQIEAGPDPSQYRLRWSARQAPVTIIVCSRSARLLERCLASLASRTSYPHREVIVLQHLGWEDQALGAVIQRHGARAVPYAGLFDFARMNNLAAREASGEVLLFLNDDVTPIEASWLERLVAQVQRPEVGAAGARLLYPSGALQHGGVAIGIGDGCGHIGRGALAAPFWQWLDLTRDVAAVTGACLAVPTALFRELGGFDERFPVNYNDTDLCLRIRRAGYRVVYDSGAILRHEECQTRRGVVTLRERKRWYEQWAEFIEAGDPFYSPHLTKEKEDLTLREDF